jgi:hypothetical protein
MIILWATIYKEFCEAGGKVFGARSNPRTVVNASLSWPFIVARYKMMFCQLEGLKWQWPGLI